MAVDTGPRAQISTLGVATSKTEVTSVCTRVRAYFSSYHLWAARDFAKKARDIEVTKQLSKPLFDIQHRAYVTCSILSSVGFLEAAINEVLKDVFDGHESYIQSIGDEARTIIKVFWEMAEVGNKSRMTILDKYQLLQACCQREQLQRDAAPFQHADLAIKLRNELMHYKPATYGVEKQHKFMTTIAKKFADNPLMDSSDSYFPDRCLGSPCAEWTVRAVTALADESFRRIGITPNYQLATVDVEALARD